MGTFVSPGTNVRRARGERLLARLERVRCVGSGVFVVRWSRCVEPRPVNGEIQDFAVNQRTARTRRVCVCGSPSAIVRVVAMIVKQNVFVCQVIVDFFLVYPVLPFLRLL